MWYNKTRLENLLMLEEVRDWFRSGLIDLQQYSNLLASKRPAYKRSNVLFRIGMFVLTTIGLYSSFGLGGLMINMFSGDTGLKVFLFLASGIAFVVLRIFIRDKDHFKSGVDEALAYNGLGLLIAGIQVTANQFDNDFVLFFLITSIPFVIIGAILLTDRFLSVLSFAGMVALVFMLILKMGIYGKLFLPFMLMLFSAFVYLVVKNFSRNEKYYFWKECLEYIGVGCLVVFYLSGNYYVVREGSVLLMNLTLAAGHDIPYAFIFYAFTALVPVFYIYYGLKNKSYAFLNLGMIFTACSILSIRYYYSILSIEMALVGGGIILLVISWWLLRYLKTSRRGISALENQHQKPLINATTEALLIAQSFGQGPVNSGSDSGTKFGGGEFGGGGAGSNY